MLIYVKFFTLLLIIKQIETLDIFTLTGTVIAGLAAYKGKDLLCNLYMECCHDERSDLYIRSDPNFTGLDEKIFGQHIALEAVTKLISKHLKRKNPSKPLVMSFHGYTGVGKNHLSNLIAQLIYSEFERTGASNFVHKFIATHIPTRDSDRLELANKIKYKIIACERSLFIFDEIDKFPEGFLDILRPYLDLSADYKRPIFIFLG